MESAPGNAHIPGRDRKLKTGPTRLPTGQPACARPFGLGLMTPPSPERRTEWQGRETLPQRRLFSLGNVSQKRRPSRCEDSPSHPRHHGVGFSRHAFGGVPRRQRTLIWILANVGETAMMPSAERREKWWEPQILFVCLALFAAASFEIDGLARDIRSISASQHSALRTVARSRCELGRLTIPLKSRSTTPDGWVQVGRERPVVQGLDAPQAPAPPRVKHPRRGTRRGSVRRSFKSVPDREAPAKPRVRSCLLTTELGS